MSKLVANVCVDDQWWGPAHGRVDPPADVAAKITNPSAWDDAPEVAEVAEPELEVATEPDAGPNPDPDDPESETWSDSGDFDWLNDPAKPVDLDAVPDDKQALLDYAAGHDLDVDARLGPAKLRTAIADLLGG